MRKCPEIVKDIYYLGVNDRKKYLFENIWPLEKGVSYNSYLIKGKCNILIDTVDSNSISEFIDKLNSALQGELLHYIIVNHMEPDHCSALRFIRNIFPDAKIIGNNKTFDYLFNYFGIVDGLVEVKDAEELILGDRKLKFFFAPMVHWPEVMMTYDIKTQCLFSADAFGSFGTLDGGISDDELDMSLYDNEILRYYSNIVGKFGVPVQGILKKLSSTPLKIIASTHGPIYKTILNIEKMLSLYTRLSNFDAEPGVVISFASMYGNTEVMAEVIARELCENGVKNIRIYDVSKTHASYIIRDVFKYSGLILGSPTYNMSVHPAMASLVEKLEAAGLKNRFYGAFGTYTWAGKAANKLYDFGLKLHLNNVYPEVEERAALKAEKFEECLALARAMAEKINVSI